MIMIETSPFAYSQVAIVLAHRMPAAGANTHGSAGGAGPAHRLDVACGMGCATGMKGHPEGIAEGPATNV